MDDIENIEDGVYERKELLDQKPPDGYLDEWAEVLAKPKAAREIVGFSSVVIFRVSDEWLALPAKIVGEIVDNRVIHIVPHRTGKIFKGVVNVRGKVQLCVSLGDIIGIEKSDLEESKDVGVYSRMFVVEWKGRRFVSIADEVFGVYLLDPDDIKKAPVSISKTDKSYTKGIFDWKGVNVACLDEELLFCALKREFDVADG